MRNKLKGKKTEMAKPHAAEAARLTADGQTKRSREKPTSRPAEKSAKPHVEKYGTGTPEAS
jgi:hypothetical protein